jgi:hypothetical protein
MSEEKRDVEEFLRRFTLRPAPTDLKRRVLTGADATKGRELFFTRSQWRAAAASGLLILTSLVADAWISGRSMRSVRHLLAEDANTRAAEAKIEQALIKEISGEDPRLERQIRIRLAAEKALRRMSGSVFAEWPGDI